MAKRPATIDELARENDTLRQLLQAGLLLADAILAGKDVHADLAKWRDAVAAKGSAD